MVKLVFISDTHNQLFETEIPEGDVLIHCGDLTGKGTIVEVVTELRIMRSKFAGTILACPGNHDWLAQHNESLYRELCKENNIVPLIHEPIEISGYKLFASPYTPTFGPWAFGKDRGEEIAEVWRQIPDDTEILITHGQPYGINDVVRVGREPLGCVDLLNRILELKHLKVYAGGHLHGGAGITMQNNVMFINASILNEGYKRANKATVLNLP